MKNNIAKKRGVLFDFDDTLAKTKVGKNMGLRQVSLEIYDYLRKRGFNVDLDKLYKEIYSTAKMMDKKKIYDRNLWWCFVIKKFLKGKIAKSLLNSLTKTYWGRVIKKSELYKDTLSILAYLKKKGYSLGLITDTDGMKGLKDKRIKLLNLKKWFNSVIVAGEDTKQTKPERTPLILISQKLNLKPKECVFVGNNPHVDILGAKKLGMATILIKRQNDKTKIKPDRIIKKLSQLKEIL